MNNLQTALAEVFPDTYSADTWSELLPAFIAHHLTLYPSQVEAYQQAMAHWQASDQATPAPEYPALPVVFGEACEEQANREGLNWRALACSLYIARDQVSHYQKRSEHYDQLCGEAVEAGMVMRQHYLTLEAGTTLGRWLN